MPGHPHPSEEPAQVRWCVSWENDLSCRVLCFSPLTRLTELLVTLGFNPPDEWPRSARERFLVLDGSEVRAAIRADLQNASGSGAVGFTE